MNRPLIAVMTCHERQFLEKAQAQRDTWAAAVQEYADVRFFCGRPEFVQREPMEDEVFLDVDDSYDGLPLKVQGICRWATERGYPQLMKVDDDVYIIPKRLRVLPFSGDYVGRFRAAPNDVYPAHFASGFAYMLSARAAKLVAEQEWNTDWMDERFVSNTLAMNGIWGLNDPRNYVVTGPHHSPVEIINHAGLREGTIYCQYGPHQIRQMHDVFRDVEVVPHKHPGLTPVERIKVTRDVLMRKPKDHYWKGSWFHPKRKQQ